nr:hypothetical protein [Chryseobacterium taklimakanense]
MNPSDGSALIFPAHIAESLLCYGLCWDFKNYYLRDTTQQKAFTPLS